MALQLHTNLIPSASSREQGTRDRHSASRNLSPEYEQCPFCDKIFEVADRTALEKHIVEQHKKVKVRKGSNYKWMDEAEVKRALSASSLSEVMR